jgi:hypothetical protein
LRTQHPRVGDGATYVVRSKANIEGNGGVEALEGLGR